MILWPRWNGEHSSAPFGAITSGFCIWGFRAGSVACSVSNSLFLCRVISSNNKHVGTIFGCVCCDFCSVLLLAFFVGFWRPGRDFIRIMCRGMWRHSFVGRGSVPSPGMSVFWFLHVCWNFFLKGVFLCFTGLNFWRFLVFSSVLRTEIGCFMAFCLFCGLKLCTGASWADIFHWYDSLFRECVGLEVHSI